MSGRRRELQALKCRVILKQMQTPEFGGVEIRDGWLEEEGGRRRPWLSWPRAAVSQCGESLRRQLRSSGAV